ncbi:nonsense-mediated mRNA decay factor SMG7-like [Diospyros lotus]|uniref:nonsense-mediated mRNA decay factor SMG7-like n=1 Tax=Diospyros lotus TaxID=55363 RepID=UPI002259AA80|nr:nonsense-mediated mRNA decay factor SMG7-like [Diospyros lotus]XP_052203022.1 nonsense-mediated mRNA decay factor SMG7-like [Diospyros lotus]
MNLDSSVSLKDRKGRKSPFFEVTSTEKQLWGLIHSKGILHTEVHDLYRKTRSGYEKIILNNHKEVELQDVECSLWMLHYMHIDEFRKRIVQTSASSDQSLKSGTWRNATNSWSSIESHKEQFKSFLLEAIQFYQDLIAKLRRRYGLPEDPLAYEKDGISCDIDSTKFHLCQYSCHRLLVCLGDLARYRELCKKLDFQKPDWSVAATYYFKAALVWPDSGNPQNQLALLATYVGDDFLALYHCIRSLAVKEPFPDAWNNLILLFDKNRSSQLDSLSKEAQFDYLNPYERSIIMKESKCDTRLASDLWPLFVRVISFFFIESSLEEFPYTFGSTVRELDSLLALDDDQLKATLESYQYMDSARTGPYRALQIVSVLIFVINSRVENLGNESDENKVQQPMLMQFLLTTTFICLGRLAERCLDSIPVELSPLLPAVLMFVEWLVGVFGKVEPYGACQEVKRSVSYFLDAFVDLVNQLDKNEGEFNNGDHIALWEDYELRGFEPLALAHEPLDFTAHSKLPCYLVNVNVCRAHRIFQAAMKISDRSDGSQKWICYDKLGRKFYTTESKSVPEHIEKLVAQSSSDTAIKELHQRREAELADSSSDHEVNDPKQYKCGATEKDAIGGNECHPFENGKPVATEDEEVILFKPITRYNSTPLFPSTRNDAISMEGSKDQTAPFDECLCHATSLSAERNEAPFEPLSYCSDARDLRNNKLSKQQEPLSKDSATSYHTGPPSLSAWVLNREISNNEKDKGTRDFWKPGLNPIDEIDSASLSRLLLSEAEDSASNTSHVSATTPYSPPPYSAPVPSAPSLPDDPIWFADNSASFPDSKSSGNTKETDGILGASPLSTCTKRSAIPAPVGLVSTIPGLIGSYRPVLGMSSSEWLHHYYNQNLERSVSPAWPVHLYAPGSVGNLYAHDTSRFNLGDRWGNPSSPNQMVYLESPQLQPNSPLIYSADEQRREKLFHNYQMPSPYGCGAVTELRADQPPILLHYLKEKEWQLQTQPQVRGPTYMGS